MPPPLPVPPEAMSPRARKVVPAPPDKNIGVVVGSAFNTGDALRFSSLTTSLAKDAPLIDAAATPRIERNGNEAARGEFDVGTPTMLVPAPMRRPLPDGFSGAPNVAPGDGEGVTAIDG